MTRNLFLSLLGVSAFCSLSSATPMAGTISGTCGFYQGNLSNVVYSQQFTGDGTFCTGFMTGGSFTNNGFVNVGDIAAESYNDIKGAAPSGYGVFATINTTYSVTQQYLVTPTNPSSTPTGTFSAFIERTGPTDDGSGLGSCNETSTFNFGTGTVGGGATVSFPLTFGKPITVTETANLVCNQYGPNFGDSGWALLTAAPIRIYDANGNLLGTATLQTVPEPASFLLIASLGLPLLYRRVRKQLWR